MTLTQLAASYRQSASLIYKRINELNEKLASGGLSRTEDFKLRGRISLLKSMYADTCITANMLEKYYEKVN